MCPAARESEKTCKITILCQNAPEGSRKRAKSRTLCFYNRLDVVLGEKGYEDSGLGGFSASDGTRISAQFTAVALADLPALKSSKIPRETMRFESKPSCRKLFFGRQEHFCWTLGVQIRLGPCQIRFGQTQIGLGQTQKRSRTLSGTSPPKIQKNSGSKKTSVFSVLLCQNIKFFVAGAPERFCWVSGRLGFDSFLKGSV